MATTRHLVPHIQPGGMDSTNPPHLVADGTWTMVRGFRVHHGRLVQMPLLFILPVTITRFPTTVFFLPRTNDGGRIIGIGPYVMRYFDDRDNEEIALLDGTTDYPYNDAFTAGESTTGMFGVIYNGQVWFLSPKTKLRYTDGTFVGGLISGNVPSARYIDTFFDHIIVGNNTFHGSHEPYTLRWSHLYDPTQWDPTDTNEADYFELVCWDEKSSLTQGITGLGRIGDTLFAHTNSTIFSCNYVGLPKVMQIQAVPRSQGLGNSLHHCLIVTQDVHFYYNRNTENFYAFNGQTVKSIGDPIKRQFTELLRSVTFRSVRGLVIEEKKEAWWVVEQDTGQMVLTHFVYNWEIGVWYMSYLTVTPTSTVYAGRFNAAISATGDTCDSFMAENTFVDSDVNFNLQPVGRCFFNNGNMYREESPGDTTSSLTSYQDPYLETKDFIADLQEVGEIDQMVIHADYVNAGGIEVYVSTRMNLHDPVVFKKVGLWTKNLRDGKVSFTPMRGRVFRYRFNPIGNSEGPCRGVVFYSYTDNLFSARAER